MSDLLELRLKKLEKSLIPSKEYIRKGKAIMQEIFTLLCQKSKYSIDRTRLLGGAKKNTSIAGKVDFDCVIYLNNCTFLSFRNVADEFKHILISEKSFGLSEDDITRTNHGLTAIPIKRAGETFKFDIILATNLVSNSSNGTENALRSRTNKHRQRPRRRKQRSAKRHKLTETERAQAENLLDNIKKMATKDQIEMAKNNSAGTSELAVEYVKNKSAFCHELARVCKYWNSTIYIDRYVSGRSSIIELLALQSGKREEKQGKREGRKRSLLKGFKRFLVDMKNIQCLDRTYFGFLYHRKDVLPEILQQRPLLLDPANAYNNFLDIDREVMEQFSHHGTEALNKLDNLQWPW